MVADAAPVSFDLVDFTPDVSAAVQGWADTSFEFESLTILQGRRFHGDEPAVMLGEMLANGIGKKAGDWVEVQGAALRVVGVFRAQDTFSASSALLPLHQLQRLSDLGTKVAGFDVRLRPPSPGVSPENHVCRAQLMIESQLPRLKAMPAGAVARDNHVMNFIRSTAWATSLIALLIAVLGVANTMAMSVFERTREIGVTARVGVAAFAGCAPDPVGSLRFGIGRRVARAGRRPPGSLGAGFHTRHRRLAARVSVHGPLRGGHVHGPGHQPGGRIPARVSRGAVLAHGRVAL